MKTFATIILVMSGICFFTAFYHLIVYIRGFKDKSHIAFSILSFLIGIYDIISAQLYLSIFVYYNFLIQNWQTIILTLSCLAFYNFILSFIKKKWDFLDFTIIIYLVINVILEFFSLFMRQKNLYWKINEPLIKDINFFNFFSITYFESSPNILLILNIFVIILLSLYVFYLLMNKYLKDREKKYLPVIISIAVFFIGVLNDMAVSVSIYKFIYLIEFTFMVIVFAMTYSLTTTIVDYAKLKHAFLEAQMIYKKLFESVSDAIFVVDKNSEDIIDANHAACKLFDYKIDELKNIKFNKLYKKNKSLRYDSYSSVITCFRKKGHVFFAENSTNELIIDNKSLKIIAIRDITEKLEEQNRLNQEKELLDITLTSITDGVITTDNKGKIILMNNVAEQFTGYKINEAIGRPLNEIFITMDQQDKNREMIKDVFLRKNKIEHIKNVILKSKKGENKLIKRTIALIKGKKNKIFGSVIVFTDITEQEKIEKELIKRQKLESLAILAGGIAHDFNNFLVGILGNINLLRFTLDENHKSFNLIMQAEKAALRAKELTQQLLTFSKGGLPVKKITSINTIIKESALFAVCGSNVKCSINIPENLWPLNVDPGQMGQVINNLIINANQSMPNGGVINITAYNMKNSQNNKNLLPENHYVVIKISDEGCGISEKNVDRVFDPFFTTKEGGSGLGLTTTYSIIKNHNGYIEVKSNLNKGTTFLIYLPAAPNEKIIMEDETVHEEYKGKGNILIIDDDKIVLNVISNMLDYLGYDFSIVNNSMDAVVYYKSAINSNKPYDAVIIDLTLPDDLSGEEILKELISIDKNTKAIVTSGYSNSPILSNYKKYGFAGILQKPYKLFELSKVLHGILNIKK
ncbi:MAG: PAS domain S-box protein [Spirochaetes bacterium]|nr:PAS domain S-box protein [Spirochaetota bacterium]